MTRKQEYGNEEDDNMMRENYKNIKTMKTQPKKDIRKEGSENMITDMVLP